MALTQVAGGLIASGQTITSPTLVTPALGTPASGVMTNVTSLPAAQLTGTQTIPKATLPTGAVLQVVQTNLTTSLSWTGDTNYHTVVSTSITPTSASSKILVQCHVQLAAQHNMNNILVLNATRNGTAIVKNTDGGGTSTSNAWGCYGGPSLATGGRLTMMYSMNYLDSPASTSSLTYTISAKLDSASNTAYVGQWSLNNDAANISSLLLMEISA